jgi:SHAQKYF class myb-like DNA-binding protein
MLSTQTPFIQPSPAFYPSNSVHEFEASSYGDVQLNTNIIIEQQRRIRILEEELKRHKDRIFELNEKLAFYEHERNKEPPKKKSQSRYWTPEEHQMFLDGLDQYGPKDVKAISACVGSRNATQVRTHAQKYFLRLLREKEREVEREKEKEFGPSDISSSPMTPEIEASPSCTEGTPKDFYSSPESSDGLDPVTRRKKISELRQTLTLETVTLSLNDFTKAEQDMCSEGIKTFKGEDIETKTELIQRKLIPKRSLQETLQLVLILEDKFKSEKPTSVCRKRGAKKSEYGPNKARKMNDNCGFMKSSFSSNFSSVPPSSFPTTYPSFSVKTEESSPNPHSGVHTPPVASPFYGSPVIYQQQPPQQDTGVTAVQAQAEESTPNKLAFAPESMGISPHSFNLQFANFPQQSLTTYVTGQQNNQHQDDSSSSESSKHVESDSQCEQQFIDISSMPSSDSSSPWMESPPSETVDSNILRVVSPRATADF